MDSVQRPRELGPYLFIPIVTVQDFISVLEEPPRPLGLCVPTRVAEWTSWLVYMERISVAREISGARGDIQLPVELVDAFHEKAMRFDRPMFPRRGAIIFKTLPLLPSTANLAKVTRFPFPLRSRDVTYRETREWKLRDEQSPKRSELSCTF